MNLIISLAVSIEIMFQSHCRTKSADGSDTELLPELLSFQVSILRTIYDVSKKRANFLVPFLSNMSRFQ